MLGVRHDAAQGTLVTTEVRQRAIDTAFVAHSPHGWPVHIPPELTRAIVMLGTSRHYADDQMVALANALLTHRLSLKFLEDFRSHPSLLLDLFTGLPSFDKLLTIGECFRAMEAVFNSRWDTANWSKTAPEAKKLSLLEAIGAHGGNLGTYMMRKEREFRARQERDALAPS